MNLKSINSRLRVPLGGAMILAMSAALPARADYQSTVLSQGPAGYWRLNETTQPAVVTTTANKGSLGATADGTYNNDPTRGLTGPFAGSVAVGFDGSSQSITTPYNAQLNTTAFSVELWANPAESPIPRQCGLRRVVGPPCDHAVRVVSRPGQWGYFRHRLRICRADVLSERHYSFPSTGSACYKASGVLVPHCADLRWNNSHTVRGWRRCDQLRGSVRGQR